MAQRGNILFLILLAVVLFAALSYAVTSSMRGNGKNASSEKAQLNAAALQNYQAQIDGAVLRLKTVGGCTDAQISYETPSGANPNNNAPVDKHCHVFNPAGGGASWQDLGLGAGCVLTSLAIGQNCNGVVYAGDSGSNRLYTTTTDLGNYTWNNGSTGHGVGWINNAGITSGDGLTNTNILVALTDTGAPYAAAKGCRTLGTDWYLPSRDEMMAIRNNRTTGALNGAFQNSAWYFTSTQWDNSRATGYRFIDNATTGAQKEGSMPVHCFRHD